MTDDKKYPFHRTVNAVLDDPEIMDNASAVDWRVLHAIERHQGYQTWRCKVSLRRIAKVARCSRTSASTSSNWWKKMGVVDIKRDRGANIYVIIKNFRPSPGRVRHTRNTSQGKKKRDSRGRYSPYTEHQSSPYTEHQSSPYTEHQSSPYTEHLDNPSMENPSPGKPEKMGNPLRSLSSEVLLQDPPFPPQGEQRTSEEKSGGGCPPFVGRVAPPPPERKDVSEEKAEDESGRRRFLRECEKGRLKPKRVPRGTDVGESAFKKVMDSIVKKERE